MSDPRRYQWLGIFTSHQAMDEYDAEVEGNFETGDDSQGSDENRDEVIL